MKICQNLSYLSKNKINNISKVSSPVSVVSSLSLPGTAAGDRGPVREGVTLAGEPTGDGEGPRMPGRWGEVCGEKGDCAGLLCSP